MNTDFYVKYGWKPFDYLNLLTYYINTKVTIYFGEFEVNTTELPLVLALDISGNPDRWITHEDVAYYKSKDLILWEHGIENYMLRGGINAKTGMQSTLDINTIVAIKGQVIDSKKHARYNRPSLTNKALFRRDHCMCAYCGNVLTNAHLTRDHIIPVSRGGKNIWENVVTACNGCNKHKDSKLLNEIGMSLLYVPYCPSRSEYLILMNRRILSDQMEYLLSKIKDKNSRVHRLAA